MGHSVVSYFLTFKQLLSQEFLQSSSHNFPLHDRYQVHIPLAKGGVLEVHLNGTAGQTIRNVAEILLQCEA